MEAAPPVPAEQAQPSNGYVGSETCVTCHTGYDRTVDATKHGFKANELTPMAKQGCESCHGPGLEHVKSDGKASAIVNPSKLKPDFAVMICMACHTDGQDKASETFPFPVGYVPGKDIRDYFTDFFMPKPKSKAWYWGSMDLLEHKRMFYFFQSKFYSTARACEVCGFDRGATQHAERYMTRTSRGAMPMVGVAVKLAVTSGS